MDREQAVRIVLDYAKRVRSVMEPNEIILYGSCAKGSAGDNSDIDVAVVFERFEGNYWEIIRKLNELTIDVDTRIEPVLLEKRNDPSGFLDVIMREGLRVI